MKILQICPSLGLKCGVNFFSNNLEKYLSEYCDVITREKAESLEKFDSCIIHYIKKIEKEEVKNIQKKVNTFLFMHHSRKEEDIIEGKYITLHEGAIILSEENRTRYKNLVIPHPCFTTNMLNRESLKEKFGFKNKIVVGTCGFINQKRKLFEICSQLIKNLDDRYVINLSCCKHSLWDSKKILSSLKKLPKNRLRIISSELSHIEINEQMQMCDITWCWTDAVQENYGSGVASDLYGSGTKMVIQDRPQHKHVIGRKHNVIITENDFSQFMKVLIRECLSMRYPRIIDESISWQEISKKIFKFTATQKIL